jgi:hypothetical protein
VNEEIRSLQQNRLMWALLTDLANQVPWAVDGRMQYISPDDYKHIMTAGLKKHQRVAAGIDGGFVILGQYTHKMNKAEMAELIELIYAFGAQRNVKWTDEY